MQVHNSNSNMDSCSCCKIWPIQLSFSLLYIVDMILILTVVFALHCSKLCLASYHFHCDCNFFLFSVITIL